MGLCGRPTPDTEHPLIVEAKKELLGTDSSTTLEQVKLQIMTDCFIFCVKDLIKLFDEIDTDKSGNLSLYEVVVFFKAITDDISIENIRNVFKVVTFI